MYFSNQGAIQEHIMNDIANNKKLFVVSGVSGTGKSFLMNKIQEAWIQTEGKEILALNGEEYSSDVELYPFDRCLSGSDKLRRNFYDNKSKIAISKLSKAVPIVGEVLEFITHSLLTIKESNVEALNASLTRKQLDIILKFKYLLSTGNYMICIDNLHWWDKKSLDLLFEMLQGRDNNMDFLSRTVFLINLTTDQFSINEGWVKKIIKKFDFQMHELKAVTKQDYKALLVSFGLTKQIDEKLIDLLYSATTGHLVVTKKIVEHINNDEFENWQQNPDFSNENSLSFLIEERLKNYGAKGDVVTEVLKYASVIGKSFSFYELEHITKKNKFEIQEIVQKANELSLIELELQGAYFIHEIVRKLFYSKLADNKSFYCHAAAECLKIVKPSQYLARANFLLEAGMISEASVLYVIEYIRKLRNQEKENDEFTRSLQLYSKELPDEMYIHTMKKCYQLYHLARYQDCIEELDIIENIYPKALLAERDYLLSICLSKKVDSKLRKRAVTCLEEYLDINNVDQEGEIWARIASLLIVSYVHVNDSDNAKKVRKQLLYYLGSRTSFDIDAQDKINILRRKAGALDSTMTALRLNLDSVHYFEPQEGSNIPLNPYEYYMSLNNYAANAMVCGQFETAFQAVSKLMDLVRNYPEVGFPRVEVVVNNYILSGFLAGQLSAKQGIDVYEDVISRKKISHSDSVLMRLNLSSLYAVNQEVYKARELLYSLRKKLRESSNIETYYEYCIESNIMVMEYLSGNKSEALSLLSEISATLPIIGDEEFYKRRHSIIKSLFDNDVESDGRKWLDILHKKSPPYTSDDTPDLWKFYGKGYIFSDTQYWSES